MMEIKILQQLEGAKKSEGLTVVIDVFRAFTVECFLYFLGAKKIYPMGDFNECLRMKKENKDYFLVGERMGIKLDGFDSGNSPTQIVTTCDVKDKVILHSTSSGTKGIQAALDNMNNIKNPVTDIITGSIDNAKAIVRYIIDKNPKTVSLVCMGLGGVYPSDEDTLCAEYIKYMLLHEGFDEGFNISEKMLLLKNTNGAQFFDKEKQKDFPMPDFFMCLMPNIFDFVLKIEKDDKNGLFYSKKLSI